MSKRDRQKKTRHAANAASVSAKPRATARATPFPEWILPLAICLISAAAFMPALSHGFIWDDRSNIIDNLNYRGLDPARLKWMFTTFHMGHYQPLSWLTLAIDYLIWGINPLGYHLTNLLLHAASTVLVYYLARRLLNFALHDSKPPQRLDQFVPIGAAVAALTFGIHPMRVESVVWVTERRDVLSSFLTLATLHCYLTSATCPDNRRTRWLLTTFCIYTLSLMSRALGVTLPVVLLLLDFYPLRRWSPSNWLAPASLRVYREKLLFLIPAIAAAIVAPIAQFKSGAATTLINHGVFQRIAQASYGLVFYIYKGLYPVNLSPHYELPLPVNVVDPKYLISMFIVIVAAIGLFLVRKKHPAVVVAVLCYAITLLPVLGFFQSGRQEVADRYSYLSTIGFTILLGAAAIRFLSKSSLRQALSGPPGAVSICLAGVLFILTWRQCLVWATPEGLWRYTVENCPPSAMAHYNFGCELAEEHKVDEAIEQYQKSIALNGYYANTHYNLGNAFQERGDFDAAEAQYKEAQSLSPDFHQIYYELGNLAAKRGSAHDAIELYRKALPQMPKHARLRQRLAAQLIERKDLDEATRLLDEALKFDSRLAEAHYDRARVFEMTGRIKDAVEEYRAAIALQPAYPEAKVNLGALFMRQGMKTEGIEQYKSALSDEPLHKEALFNMAVAHSVAAEWNEAEEYYQKVIAAYPDFSPAHFNLGTVLTNANRLEEAKAAFEQVLKIEPENESARKNLEALRTLSATSKPAK